MLLLHSSFTDYQVIHFSQPLCLILLNRYPSKHTSTLYSTLTCFINYYIVNQNYCISRHNSKCSTNLMVQNYTVCALYIGKCSLRPTHPTIYIAYMIKVFGILLLYYQLKVCIFLSWYNLTYLRKMTKYIRKMFHYRMLLNLAWNAYIRIKLWVQITMRVEVKSFDHL